MYETEIKVKKASLLRFQMLLNGLVKSVEAKLMFTNETLSNILEGTDSTSSLVEMTQDEFENLEGNSLDLVRMVKSLSDELAEMKLENTKRQEKTKKLVKASFNKLTKGKKRDRRFVGNDDHEEE